MKIYTKTGDDGTSSLFGGERVKKNDPRLEAYGTVDELNSFLGLTIVHIKSDQILKVVSKIQSNLFSIGARLATPPAQLIKLKNIEQISDAEVKQIENEIDALESQLEPIKNFIIPGGCVGANHLHIARAICRRCERRIIAIDSEENNLDILIRYINRISDYLFVAARFENKINNVPDSLWKNK
ncbi:MAG: cob(I)yrinic acid a,c-diamide adenosyltransferase [Ignavibacteria bacterium]|nr:cob(I)yrinic acid a,c-diamide adenosyltransferase [Ignavibacteria bacterium]